MTQDDLDKLKDVTDLRCAIYQDEKDGMVEDVHGEWWLTGRLNGEAVKRRLDAGAEFYRSSFAPLNGAEQ